MSDKPTPADIAAFDQARAEIHAHLTHLTNALTDAAHTCARGGHPPEAAVAAMARFIHEEYNHEQIAQMLAVHLATTTALTARKDQ